MTLREEIKQIIGHGMPEELAELKTDQVFKALSDDIQLTPVYGSRMCEYTVIENKLEILYKNQEKLLLAIKLNSK